MTYMQYGVPIDQYDHVEVVVQDQFSRVINLYAINIVRTTNPASDITANCTDYSGKDYAWSWDIPFELDGLTYTHISGTVEHMLARKNGDFSFYYIGNVLCF